MSFASVSSSIDRGLNHPITKWVLSSVLIAGIVLIRYIPTNVLQYFTNIYVQILFAVLIAFLACTEPIYALLVTLFLAVALYEVNNRLLALSAVAMKLNGGSNIYGNMETSNSRCYQHLNDKRLAPVPDSGLLQVGHTTQTTDELISIHNLQSPVMGDNVSGPDLNIGERVIKSASIVDIEPAEVTEARGWSHPASRTLTENMMGSVSGRFPTNMNIVTGIDPDDMNNSITNAGEFNVPHGYDITGSQYSAALL